jgi:cobalt/nickel transport system permease protein
LIELYTHCNSHIHRMDARIKLVLTLAFIVCLNLLPIHAWAAFILFLSLAISVTLLSKLRPGSLLKRSLIALPFALAALPLIFTGPAPMTPLTLLDGIHLDISLAGTERFAAIAVRSWISLQAAVLLASTTRFDDLMTALRQLKVPQLFVSIIALMWRYLFVIKEEVTHMLRARNSRCAAAPAGQHGGGSLAWRARVTGGMAGSLFLRALERSDRVYAAMLSRGYSAEIPVSRNLPLSVPDRRTLWLGSLLLLVLTLFGIFIGG